MGRFLRRDTKPKDFQDQIFRKKSDRQFVRGGKTFHETVWFWRTTFFLWSLFFGVSFYIVFFSGVLTVENIHIYGASKLSSDSIREVLLERFFGSVIGIERKNFILFSPRQAAYEIQERFPLVASVDVKRKFPRTVEVFLREHEEFYFWCSGGPCYFIDKSGRIQDSVKKENEHSVPHWYIIDESGANISFGDEVLRNDFASSLHELVRGLNDDSGIRIRDTLFVPSRFADEIRVETEGGYMIFLSTAFPFEKAMNALRITLEKEIASKDRDQLAYIDLRSEGKVFYAFQKAESDVVDSLEKEGGASNIKKKDEGKR